MINNKQYVVDSSVVLSVIRKENGYLEAIKYLGQSVISSVNASEVISVLVSYNFSDEVIDKTCNRLMPIIIPFDEKQSNFTGKLKRQTVQYGLSLGDRACINLGIIYKLPVITADKIWKDLKIDDLEIVLIR